MAFKIEHFIYQCSILKALEKHTIICKGKTNTLGTTARSIAMAVVSAVWPLLWSHFQTEYISEESCREI